MREKQIYYVDCPNPKPPDSENTWLALRQFKTRAGAIRFIKRVYGGDEEGRVSMLYNSQ